jgi:hypothetical protein
VGGEIERGEQNERMLEDVIVEGAEELPGE